MIGLGHLDMSKLFSSMTKKVILNMINLGSALNLPDKNNLDYSLSKWIFFISSHQYFLP